MAMAMQMRPQVQVAYDIELLCISIGTRHVKNKARASVKTRLVRSARAPSRKLTYDENPGRRVIGDGQQVPGVGGIRPGLCRAADATAPED